MRGITCRYSVISNQGKMYIDRDSKPKKKVKFKIDSVLAIIEDASDWEEFSL